MPAAAPAPHGRAGHRLRTSRQAARHLLPGGKRLSPLANTSGQCLRSPGRPPRKRPPPQGCAAPARRQLHTQRPAAAAVAFNAPPPLAPAVTARSFPKPRVRPPPGRGEGRGGERRDGRGGSPGGRGAAAAPARGESSPAGLPTRQRPSAAPVGAGRGERKRRPRQSLPQGPAPGAKPHRARQGRAGTGRAGKASAVQGIPAQPHPAPTAPHLSPGPGQTPPEAKPGASPSPTLQTCSGPSWGGLAEVALP